MTPLTWLTISWILGIFLARVLHLSFDALGVVAILPLAGLYLYRKSPPNRFIAINGFVLLLGASRLIWASPTINANHIAFYNDNESVTVIGKIVAEPDTRDNYTNLTIAAERVTTPHVENHKVAGLILARVPRYPAYFYGDTLTLTSKLETPPVFTDFSYRDFLARKDIHTLMRRPRIDGPTETNNLSLKAWLIQAKLQASQRINEILPEPQASLLNGILLGIRQGIPQDLYERFNKTGASHVIVISGSNIAIVIALLLLVGQYLIGKRYAVFLAIVGIILYTILVGADASVTRAAIMGIFYVIAIFFGRQNHSLNGLALATLIMTIQNPFTVWDVGFQLSFLATLGLIVLGTPLEQSALAFIESRTNTLSTPAIPNLLREAVFITIAAQIMVTPLLLYQFGRLPLIGLLTNLLIVPVQPLIMIFGGLATLGGLIYAPFGQVLGWLVWLPITWTVFIVDWTAAFSWAEIKLPAFPLWLMALSYLSIGIGVWWLHNPKRSPSFNPVIFNLRRSTLFGLGSIFIILVLTWSATQNMPDGNLHVAFLDIGQGDAIFITTPNGRQMLIDGGPSPAQLGYRLGQEMPFWDRSIDLIINTHSDLDHLGGLVEIIDRYTINSVLIGDTVSDSALHKAWLHQLDAENLTPTLTWQNMTFQIDEAVTVTILNPGIASQFEDTPNNRSIVLKLQMGAVSFLLPGDIEAVVERSLVRNDLDLQATVLKSPHHGSQTSSTLPFLQKVNPQLVVISAGADNRFGHPHTSVLDRYQTQGIQILRTDLLGTVELITNGEQLWVETNP
ncbi:MAG: DNA internalization-related competence protein ComEC/Rec2 [Chloroflexota bacterium]